MALLALQSQARDNSHRDIEDLLAERGITVVMATRFTLMKSSPVCRTIQINGKQHYLFKAVDQVGKWLTYIYKQSGMGRQSGSSAVYCEAMVQNPGIS